MGIIEVQNEIIEEFSLFEDWMQRYEYMIELGKAIELICYFSIQREAIIYFDILL